MLDDLVLEYGDKEIIKVYFEYSEKVDKAARREPFIICGKEMYEKLIVLEMVDMSD